jgi:hypothetical protein
MGTLGVPTARRILCEKTKADACALKSEPFAHDFRDTAAAIAPTCQPDRNLNPVERRHTLITGLRYHIIVLNTHLAGGV